MPDPEKVTPSRLASPDGQEVGKKHARHASDENTSPAETKPDDRSASPVDETKPDAMGDFGVDSIAFLDTLPAPR